MRTSTRFALTFLSSALLAACTVIPRDVDDSLPSLDGGQMTSGLVGFADRGGQRFGVLTANARDRYNGLVAIYGARFIPPLREDAGVAAESPGAPNTDFLIDKQHLRYFATMSRWRREGR